MNLRRALVLASALLLVACGADAPAGPPQPDPALSQRCGGGPLAFVECPDGYVCLGGATPFDGYGGCRKACRKGYAGCDLLDTCVPHDPACTDVGCAGRCEPPACGVVTGQTCPDDYACIDDSTDTCTPGQGPPCVGICAHLQSAD